MKKYLPKFLNELFTPTNAQDLDVYAVLDALKDQMVLKLWLFEVLQQIKQLNLQVDRALLSGETYSIQDLSAKRKAIQDVLEAAVSIHGDVKRGTSHNPLKKTEFDFESVTVKAIS